MTVFQEMHDELMKDLQARGYYWPVETTCDYKNGCILQHHENTSQWKTKTVDKTLESVSKNERPAAGTGGHSLYQTKVIS
jgi:hypothetical protein